MTPLIKCMTWENEWKRSNEENVWLPFTFKHQFKVFATIVSFPINLVFNPFVRNQSYGDGPFLKIFLPRDSELSTHSSTVFAEQSDISLHTFTDSPILIQTLRSNEARCAVLTTHEMRLLDQRNPSVSILSVAKIRMSLQLCSRLNLRSE